MCFQPQLIFNRIIFSTVLILKWALIWNGLIQNILIDSELSKSDNNNQVCFKFVHLGRHIFSVSHCVRLTIIYAHHKAGNQFIHVIICTSIKFTFCNICKFKIFFHKIKLKKMSMALNTSILNFLFIVSSMHCLDNYFSTFSATLIVHTSKCFSHSGLYSNDIWFCKLYTTSFSNLFTNFHFLTLQISERILHSEIHLNTLATAWLILAFSHFLQHLLL